MQTLLADLRFASRSLLARPGFLAAALITIALGTGANAAIATPAPAMSRARIGAGQIAAIASTAIEKPIQFKISTRNIARYEGSG